MSGLPRDVLEWLQGLGLSRPIRHLKRDMSNGYLVAEIFSKVYPYEFQMLKFSSMVNSGSRKANWEKIMRYLGKHHHQLPTKLAEGTANMKDDAAIQLLITIHAMLHNKHRTPSRMPVDPNPNFLDFGYQRTLRPVQRYNLALAIQRHFKQPEVVLKYTTVTPQDKVRQVCELYKEERASWKKANPSYYGVKQSLRERAVRRAGPSHGSRSRRYSNVSGTQLLTATPSRMETRATLLGPKSSRSQIASIDTSAVSLPYV